MFLAGGPLLRVQTTCLGDQTHRRTSVEDVWPWGVTPPLGGVPAVPARLGVVSPAFSAPGDVPEGTNTSFDDASQGMTHRGVEGRGWGRAAALGSLRGCPTGSPEPR